MQATRNRARKPAKASAPAPVDVAGHSEREIIESVFSAYGLPGWLGWGTYGAESSWGATKSGHYFGLIMPSYSGQRPNDNLGHDAEISARLYRQLLDQYGSLPEAMAHYSGNSYGIAHIEELGKGATQAPNGGQGKAVTVSLLDEIGKLPLLESVNPFNWINPDPSETPPGKEFGRITGGISTIGGLIEFLTSGETWLRAGEILAGAILIILGLKGLTGVDFPSAVPVPV